jgi:hypothetical protein
VASELLLFPTARVRRGRLPFTSEAFFDLLAAYNTSLWPAIVALWVGVRAGVRVVSVVIL